MNAEGRGTPPDLSADAQALLSAISERGSIGNGRLRTTTGLDEDAYKAAVAELVAAGLVRRGRGRGGSVALVGDSAADAATNGTSTRRSPEGPRPAARENGEGEEAAVDPGALAGPGGLFAKIRTHVDTDVPPQEPGNVPQVTMLEQLFDTKATVTSSHGYRYTYTITGMRCVTSTTGFHCS